MLNAFTAGVLALTNDEIPTFRAILLSNPPGNNSTAASCLISSGLTYYVPYGFVVTNGLEIFTDTGLTTRLFTSDPLAPGFYVWLKDIGGSNLEYAVDFDASGLVDTVTSC